MSAVSSELRAHIRTHARGRGVVPVLVSDLYSICDAVDQIAAHAEAEKTKLEAALAQRDARITHLEANLQAAERRRLRRPKP